MFSIHKVPGRLHGNLWLGINCSFSQMFLMTENWFDINWIAANWKNNFSWGGEQLFWAVSSQYGWVVFPHFYRCSHNKKGFLLRVLCLQMLLIVYSTVIALGILLQQGWTHSTTQDTVRSLVCNNNFVSDLACVILTAGGFGMREEEGQFVYDSSRCVKDQDELSVAF